MVRVVVRDEDAADVVGLAIDAADGLVDAALVALEAGVDEGESILLGDEEDVHVCAADGVDVREDFFDGHASAHASGGRLGCQIAG